MKPRLLDLFCGAGGAAMGYHLAGFEVVGVDIEPQPHYPFEFIQGDALGVSGPSYAELESGFDAIHASPPCQAYTSMNRKHPGSRAAHPSLIAPTRELLRSTGLPYVIENVVGAVRELEAPMRLCGFSFGLPIHRHRLFESNLLLMSGGCPGGADAFGVYGKLDGRRLWTRADGSEYHAPKTLEEAREAMGMPWSDWHGIKEAIPPAYTEWIGRQLIQVVSGGSTMFRGAA